MPFDQLNHDQPVVGEEIKRRRDLVSAAYQSQWEKYKKKFVAIPNIRFLTENVLYRRPTDGTLFQTAITTLQEAGIQIPRNIGGLMTALALDSENIREIAHDCGSAITSEWLAQQFRILAEFS